MPNSPRTSLILTGLLQLLLIALSCVVAFYLTREINIIPKFILRLPSVFVSSADMWAIVRIFCWSFAVQITFTSLMYRSGAFAGAKRFGSEYLFYLVAYTSASLYAFLATTINYDPQLIAAIGVFSTFFYILAYIFAGRGRAADKPATSVSAGLGAILSKLLSIPGLMVLLYFLLPLMLGLAFTKDRDIANRITQVRIWFNPVENSDWGFSNFFPGQVFEQPMLVLPDPDQGDKYYVLERIGRVYSVVPGATPQLELDLSARLGEVEVENGALGIAFHPEFGNQSAGKRLLYLHYTDTRGEDGQVNRISSFDLAVSGLEGRAASERALLELDRSRGGFHNGGSLEFGPDAYLYIAIGEGVHTSGGKTSAQALRAGILRIDVNEESGAGLDIEPFQFGKLDGYRVPADNPFIDNSEVRNEYWALGLRNPYRISFDPLSGKLWVGDVGSTVWEEVNHVRPGKHYGYPMEEGREPTGVEGWESLGLPLTGPVYTYMHDAYDRAVIGGIVYRGDLYPELNGQYIFADNYSAKLFSMPLGQPVVDEVTLLARANQYAQRGVSSVTQLPSGEILVTTLGAASEPSGEVLKLVRAEDADAVAPVVSATAAMSGEYDEAIASSLYMANCARCHGGTGDGMSPDAAMLGVPLPDLTSPLFHSSRSDEQIYRVIAEGGAAVGMSPMMPPWEGALSADEMEALVQFIRSLPDKHHRH